MVERTRSKSDARQSLLRLTSLGKKTFAALDTRSNNDVRRTLGGLEASEQARVVAAMQAIERRLGPEEDRLAPFILRPPRPGDYGWVIHRHGALYAEEYGWNEEFEALVGAEAPALATAGS